MSLEFAEIETFATSHDSILDQGTMVPMSDGYGSIRMVVGCEDSCNPPVPSWIKLLLEIRGRSQQLPRVLPE